MATILVPAPIPMYRFLPQTKQFSDTSWLSHNSIQFWHYLPGDSIRFNRLRAQSHKTAPTTDADHKSKLLLVLLTNWIQIRDSYDRPPPPRFLGLINLLEQLTELRKPVIWIHSWMKGFLGWDLKDLKCRSFCLHGIWGPAWQHVDVFWFTNLEVSEPCPFGVLWKLHYIGMID